MRIGYAISGTRSASDTVAVARLVEAAGFDEVWLAEDYFERGAFAVAGALAAATTRVQLGVGVVNPWTRHPVLTAMEFAALDELSAGRAVLGLGTSNSHWMSDQLGIPFERPLGRLVEAVDLIRGVLSGQPVSHHGPAFDVEAGLSFRPLRPNAPIILGVKGPNALRQAGAIADGVLLSVLSSADYVRWARSQLGRADRRMAGYVFLSCQLDAAEARDAARPHVAKYLGIHGDHAITRQAGLEPELCARFRAGVLAGQPATDLVTDDILDRVALAGDREACAQGLCRLTDAGLETVVFIELPGQSAADLVAASLACADLASAG